MIIISFISESLECLLEQSHSRACRTRGKHYDFVQKENQCQPHLSSACFAVPGREGCLGLRLQGLKVLSEALIFRNSASWFRLGFRFIQSFGFSFWEGGEQLRLLHAQGFKVS